MFREITDPTPSTIDAELEALVSDLREARRERTANAAYDRKHDEATFGIGSKYARIAARTSHDKLLAALISSGMSAYDATQHISKLGK